MTLEEAIKHCNEVAELLEEEANSFDLCDRTEKQMACNSGKCAAEHRQLAKWLEELKARRAADEEKPMTNGEKIGVILPESAYISVDRHGYIHIRGIDGTWLDEYSNQKQTEKTCKTCGKH